MLDEKFDSLAAHRDDIARKLEDYFVNDQSNDCFCEIELWEQEETANIKATAAAMRNEVIEVVEMRLRVATEKLGSLTDKINEARQDKNNFDEIELKLWDKQLNIIKKLTAFKVTIKKFKNGLELLITGERIENIISSLDTDQSRSDPIPITSDPQLQSVYDNHTNPEIIPTTSNNVIPTHNMQSDQMRNLVLSVDIESHGGCEETVHITNERPTTTVLRHRAAEIPFEHRSFYPLRWRVDH
ncbi:unnamed protein product [Rotaria sp. Silwood2]|nr:unnamed protein product [Rotaria sp. Silwood2]CAF2680164.1 unnamed protein product [Rotaria sp. Silwood2]CAF2872946.1 unnamed protein product [Rotaria sp. Silwood2]CAF3025247.1 unnamed protein product [Rotaria sp. Silwood2]CAF3894467.1 unnamed protein product [Rotaria sp. Silwood2]